MASLKIILFIISAFLAAAGIGYLVSIFNSLIQVKNNISKAWENIDVLLLQRNDELPKLIELTKGYAAHEKEVMEKIVKLRSLYGKVKKISDKARIENDLASRLSRMKAVWEGYPNLKANIMFQNVQTRISELETMISGRRVFFNETVKIYNTQIEQFPHIIFSQIMRYRPHPYLNIPESKKV